MDNGLTTLQRLGESKHKSDSNKYNALHQFAQERLGK
jgi:hypothetical protein